jgi:hypothetical protein
MTQICLNIQFPNVDFLWIGVPLWEGILIGLIIGVVIAAALGKPWIDSSMENIDTEKEPGAP